MSEELVQAAFDGDADAVARLLDGGADVNQNGRNWNPLHAAIEAQDLACVQLLLGRSVNIEHRVRTMTPLAHAVDIAIDGTIQAGGGPGDEPTEIINLLLAAGADPKPALEVAQSYQSVRIVELLTRAMKDGPE